MHEWKNHKLYSHCCRHPVHIELECFATIKSSLGKFIIKQNDFFSFLQNASHVYLNGVLMRTLFPWHTSDNVPLVRHCVDSCHVYKILAVVGTS